MDLWYIQIWRKDKAKICICVKGRYRERCGYSDEEQSAIDGGHVGGNASYRMWQQGICKGYQG